MGDQSKRQRLEAELKEWLQNSEEGKQLRERSARQAKFLDSPEWYAFWDATKACVKGEEAPMWKLAEERVGRKPDSLMVVKLEATLPQVGDLTPRYMWELLESHKTRLRKNEEAHSAWKSKQYASVRRGIKRYPSIDLALEALALKGQTREQVLEEMIPGITYIEQRQTSASSNLAGRVASQIRREGIEQPHDPGKVLAPGPGHLLEHADEQELARWADREFLEWKAQDSGVTEQEWESFIFATLFDNQVAAEICGRSANQIAQEKFRASNKLRHPAYLRNS